MSGQSDLISLRKYAQMRRDRGLPGGSLAAVQKAIASGRIRPIDGKIDPEVADIQWSRNTDPAQQKRGAGERSFESPQPADVLEPPAMQTSAPGDELTPEQDPVNRIREAALTERVRRELLEHELQMKKGELVRAADVRQAANEKARIARDALLAIPDRLAPLVAVESDPAKVHALLATEMRRVCAELAAGEAKPTRQ